MNTIKSDFDDIKIQEINEFEIVNLERLGDLQNMLQLNNRKYISQELKRKNKPNYKIKEFERIDDVIVEKGNPIVISNGHSNYNVIVFRDSFSISLIPLLSQQFRHVEYFWTRDFEKNKKYILKHKPDIIIEECVERALQNLIF